MPPSPAPAANATTPAAEESGGIHDEIALCLSGGGYRAMIFHLGCLIRLNEVGLLKKLGRVSSVSGGSITSGYLGLQWKHLTFNAGGVATNLIPLVVDPIRAFGGVTIDAESIIGGILNPFHSISDEIGSAYRKHLFGNATLQDLPDDALGQGPRFVINATNVQTGALWRFSRPFMGDYKVGLVKTPAFSLASAVTASSAFPPVLSPVQLDLSGFVFQPDPTTTLQTPAFTAKVMLSDGGVYDNMGLETAWKHSKTLLVSDAGAPFAPDESPHTDWARHSIRVLDLIDNQVRARRRIELIEAFKEGTVHNGAYWGIKTRLNDYPQPGNLSCPDPAVKELAATPTRLKALDQAYQSRLINWGYAVAAAALSSHFPGPIAKPAAFPYPGGI